MGKFVFQKLHVDTYIGKVNTSNTKFIRQYGPSIVFYHRPIQKCLILSHDEIIAIIQFVVLIKLEYHTLAESLIIRYISSTSGLGLN